MNSGSKSGSLNRRNNQRTNLVAQHDPPAPNRYRNHGTFLNSRKHAYVHISCALHTPHICSLGFAPLHWPSIQPLRLSTTPPQQQFRCWSTFETSAFFLQICFRRSQKTPSTEETGCPLFFVYPMDLLFYLPSDNGLMYAVAVREAACEPHSGGYIRAGQPLGR